MKINFFLKNFNKLMIMLLISLLVITIALALKTPLASLSNSNKANNLINYVSYFANTLLIIGGTILIIIILLIIIEVYKRIKYDSISNLVKSVVQTIKIRKFLKQDESYVNTNFSNNSKTTKVNQVVENFNKNIKHCIVDKKINKIIILFKIPSKQQSQKILKDMEEQLIDEVTYLNPDYYFSNIQRNKKYIYIEGNKR